MSTASKQLNAGAAFYKLKRARDTLAHLHRILNVAVEEVARSSVDSVDTHGRAAGIWTASIASLRSLEFVTAATEVDLNLLVKDLEGKADAINAYIDVREGGES